MKATIDFTAHLEYDIKDEERELIVSESEQRRQLNDLFMSFGCKDSCITLYECKLEEET